MDYPKTGLSQYPQEQLQSPYDAHQRAVSEWFEACKAFAESSNRRAAAEKQLESSIQVLGQHIDQTRSDPTQPQAVAPSNSGTNVYYGSR